MVRTKEANPCTPISSFVKGVEITVFRDTIATALNIPDCGPTFDMRGTTILFQHGVSFDGEEEEHTTNRQIINEAKLASMGFSHSINDEKEEEEAIVEGGPTTTLQLSHEAGLSLGCRSSMRVNASTFCGNEMILRSEEIDVIQGHNRHFTERKE
ncbi:hypothetical protein M9H77_02830 [Catharanthus roseus]|uniref:Uncharacterized protein n=1 Tax=Catharanthus roseus TaxID=4058 RepID=A0ACC0C9P0_CATRO|nr:hypothetical protein M9H77_02830 [Catharanthus roseus]